MSLSFLTLLRDSVLGHILREVPGCSSHSSWVALLLMAVSSEFSINSCCRSGSSYSTAFASLLISASSARTLVSWPSVVPPAELLPTSPSGSTLCGCTTPVIVPSNLLQWSKWTHFSLRGSLSLTFASLRLNTLYGPSNLGARVSSLECLLRRTKSPLFTSDSHLPLLRSLLAAWRFLSELVLAISISSDLLRPQSFYVLTVCIDPGLV